MAKKGDIARQNVMQTIVNAFGADYVCTADKKIYVMSSDGGSEKLQFAISITMPKTPINAEAGINSAAAAPMGNPNDWSSNSDEAQTVPTMSAEDSSKIDELMKILGIG